MKKTNLASIIRERRAVKKNYTNQPVTKELVLELLDDASWAPNHGMREPWRFIFVSKEELPAFAKIISSTYPEITQENRENYLNEPNAILVVIMQAPGIPKLYDENYGAISALIQNFWLLAWERELGVVWKTNPHVHNPKVAELLDVNENEKIVAFLHLGYFDEQPEIKERMPIKQKFTRFKG